MSDDQPTTAPDPDAPPAPVVIDLDAIRAAHAAENEVGPVLRWNGNDYQLPPRLPLRVLSNVAGLMRGSFASLHDTFVALFGDDIANELFATIDHADTTDLLNQVGGAYGISLGN